jgi:hypothetical protein
MPTGDDLVRRVEERGGEIRLCRSTIQYRPPSVLTMEAKWIRDHCEELVRALAAPDPSDAGDAASIRILAEAGGWLEIARFELPRGANRAVVGWIVAP